MGTALLLIDLQIDYFAGGAMALRGPEDAVRQAARVLGRFRAMKQPVIHVQHLALEPGATFFLPGSDGALIHAAVAPVEGELVITKHYPNAFRETPLREHLDALGVDELVVAGMMTHMCVDSSVRAAYDVGLHCTVVGDACATLDQHFGDIHVSATEVQAAFLSALDGTFAEVFTAEALLSA